MKKRLAVWGWWQGRNLGDNWIRRTVSGLFPEAEFIDTRVQNFSAYDFVICGGGGLFIYDVIKPWVDYTQKTPYGILGLGAEFPHRTEQAQKLSRNAAFFYVRDRYTLDCMKIYDTEQSYDITFASPLSFTDDGSLDMNKVFFVWRDGREHLGNALFKEYICYEDKADEYDRIIADAFDEIRADDFQTGGDDIEHRIDGCGFVISGRYHGIVAAIQKGLPCIAIDICPKIRALMRECGLEEYCIKINQTEKLRELIDKAKSESEAIRKKQLVYREKAVITLQGHIANARAAVDRVFDPLRVLHYGSYWMGENDVVKAMADDLGKIYDSQAVDLKVYTKAPDGRIKAKITTPNGLICMLDTEKIRKDIEMFRPDAVVLNSGGLVLEDSGFKMLSKLGIVSVGIELSDPDVYPYNGAFYAGKFNLFYTNSTHSLTNQYDGGKVNIRLLPFAASTDHHFVMPDIEKKDDLVVVGHAREDRIRVVRELGKSCRVGVYGRGWETGPGEVSGLEHVKAINSGLMYLSFAKTVAGYDNVKVGLFEAMACRQVVITRYMEELKNYFEPGKEVICYREESELPGIVAYYLTHEDEREAIRKNAYARFLKEHTWLGRWRTVKADIIAFKTAKFRPGEDRKGSAPLSDAGWSRLYDRALADRIYGNIQNGNLSAQSMEMLRLSRENDRILEIGCGSGATTASLAQNGRQCTALDFQEESLVLTKGLCDRLGCAVSIVKADARAALPFEAGAFDIAFQAGLLEHFDREERVDMLRRWRPCCRKMISLIPNAASLGYRMGKGLMEKAGTWPYGRELPQYSLVREFEQAGYRVTDEYTVGEKNAVNLLPKTHYLRQALEKWMTEMDLCGDNCGQGYLLVTIGENPEYI
jgi:hypothetical protein